MTDLPKFYVKVIMAKDKVIGYGVYDNDDGIVTEHHTFMVEECGTKQEALHLARASRDDMNDGYTGRLK